MKIPELHESSEAILDGPDCKELLTSVGISTQSFEQVFWAHPVVIPQGHGFQYSCSILIQIKSI